LARSCRTWISDGRSRIGVKPVCNFCLYGTYDNRGALTAQSVGSDADETPTRCELGMSEKCIELDAKIGRYEQMARMITDQRTLDGIAKVIEEANAEKKAALHPERKQ
jgi:hypothetical protein